MTWIPFSWYCCVSIDFLQVYYGKDTSRQKLIICFSIKSYIQLGVSWVKYYEEAKWKPPRMEGPCYLLLLWQEKQKVKAPLENIMLIFIGWCSNWYQKSCKLHASSTGFSITEIQYFFYTESHFMFNNKQYECSSVNFTNSRTTFIKWPSKVTMFSSGLEDLWS